MTVTNDEWVTDDAAEMADEALESAGMAAEAVVATAEDELAAARAEAARNLDGWQRTQAEFANARKRFEKQRAEEQDDTADVGPHQKSDDSPNRAIDQVGSGEITGDEERRELLGRLPQHPGQNGPGQRVAPAQADVGHEAVQDGEQDHVEEDSPEAVGVRPDAAQPFRH